MPLIMKGFNGLGNTENGAALANSLRQVVIKDAYGTAIPSGDPVAWGTAGNAGAIISCPETAQPIGILREVRYVDANRELQIRPNFIAGTTNAGIVGDGITDVLALIEPVNDKQFAMTVDDANLTQADIGLIKRIKGVGTADAFGYSTAVVDMDASVTTELRLVRIEGILGRPDNAFGTEAVAIVSVV